jgi:hypothetical protein
LFTLQSCTTSGYFETAPIARNEVLKSPLRLIPTIVRVGYVYPPIYSSDVVLVYRLAGSNSQGDVWNLLPESFYFSNGALDFGYKFDYTNRDVDIYMIGNDLQSVTARI